ncbi:MAG: hypothetical protein J6Y10_10990 [Lachnospiraceae bacterium]|nr:hypothetical protein [Lachnospiraceae bacterium]
MNNGKRYTYLYATVFAVFLFFLFFSLGLHYLGSSDFSYVLRWWLTLLILGLAFQPLTIVIFRNLRDGGWLFSKTLGIALAGWLMWFLSSCRLFKFSRFNCAIAVLVVFIINLGIYYLMDVRKARKASLRKFFTDERICAIIGVEAIFFCAFVFWCYLKGVNPKAYGTERFMDYGFMMSMFKSDYMPPKDVWLAGKSINYYYVGQYLMTYLTKLAGVPVAHGYNIAMAMLASMGFALSYSIGNNLMNIYLSYRSKKSYTQQELQRLAELGSVTTEKQPQFFRPLMAGTLSALAVAVAGNMHYPYYKFLYPKLQRLWGVEEAEIYSKYWFPDATRYIGYRPDVPDKTIHEFPIYSYAIGDLHAHVITMIFVLTVLTLLIAWLTYRRRAMDIVRDYDRRPRMLGYVKETFRPELVLCAFLVGLFQTTNYWDFPIYFVVCGAVILFSNLVSYRYKAEAWILTGFQAAMFLVVGAITAMPFTLSFDSISSSIGINDLTHHTSQFQLLILWGLPFFCVCMFLVLRILEFGAESRAKKSAGQKPLPKNLESEVITDAEGDSQYRGWKSRPAIQRLLDSLEISDLFVVIIGLCAFGLVLLPEIIYVVDIYGGAYQRANTMFKLTYQAFIMYGLSMGYIITRFVTMPSSRLMKGAGIFAMILLLSCVGYFNEAYVNWFDGYYKGLDASAFIREDCNTADADIIDYINTNIDGQVNILEMSGLSYTYFNRISTFTGMPTVLGWQTHEWLWRSSGADKAYPRMVAHRHEDVITLYTSKDKAKVSYLIEKYDLDYIYVGICEHVDGYVEGTGEGSTYVQGKTCRNITVNEELLKSLGEVVKEAQDNSGNVAYLIKIDRELTAKEMLSYELTVADFSNEYELSPIKVNVDDYAAE